MKFIAERLQKHKGPYDLILCDIEHADRAVKLLASGGALAFVGDSPTIKWAIDNDFISFRFYPTIAPHTLNASSGRSSLLSRSLLHGLKHPLVYDGESCCYQHEWIRSLQANRILVVGSMVNNMADSLRHQRDVPWLKDLHIVFLRDQ